MKKFDHFNPGPLIELKSVIFSKNFPRETTFSSCHREQARPQRVYASLKNIFKSNVKRKSYNSFIYSGVERNDGN